MDKAYAQGFAHAYLTEHFPGRMGFAVEPLETRDIDPEKVNTHAAFGQNGELTHFVVVIPDDITGYNSYKPHHEMYGVPVAFVRPDGTEIYPNWYGDFESTGRKTRLSVAGLDF